MKLKGDLFGVVAGEVYPRTIKAGEECPPELEEAARALDVLDEPDGGDNIEAKAQKGAPENKAKE